jgi:predicted nucleic acid-binding protein
LAVKLVLDTNAYSDYAEGEPEVVEYMAVHGDHLFLPSIVLGELHYGFMKGRRREFNERKLLEFLDRLKVTVIAVDENVAKRYASIYLSLAKKGNKIPINDVWIAASCMEIGGVLLTRDSHFGVVDQIEAAVLGGIASGPTRS